jgi:UDP-N-acetylglucosamine transferase subunit ALG13
MVDRHHGMECLVQSGTSKPPVVAPFADYVRYDEMVSAMERAVAVVCHGGPATIMDARRYGRVPIVLPRCADLGEHVDNHQQRFANKMAELGQIHLVIDKEDLFELLDKAMADPDVFAIAHSGDEIAAAVRKFEQLVDGLFRR